MREIIFSFCCLYAILMYGTGKGLFRIFMTERRPAPAGQFLPPEGKELQ